MRDPIPTAPAAPRPSSALARQRTRPCPPDVDTDVITFFGVGGGANAIGGLFFGSDTPGNFVSATIVLTVTDSLGATSMQTIAASPTSFLGFVSNGTIATVVVGTATPRQFIFPTVDDLTIAIAAVSAVPETETETWSLLGAGLMALALFQS